MLGPKRQRARRPGHTWIVAIVAVSTSLHPLHLGRPLSEAERTLAVNGQRHFRRERNRRGAGANMQYARMEKRAPQASLRGRIGSGQSARRSEAPHVRAPEPPAGRSLWLKMITNSTTGIPATVIDAFAALNSPSDAEPRATSGAPANLPAQVSAAESAVVSDLLSSSNGQPSLLAQLTNVSYSSSNRPTFSRSAPAAT